jgi:hypothetical protein
MTIDQLQAIIDDSNAQACAVIAARRTLAAMSDEGYLAMHTTGMLLDYTDGRPVNHVKLEATVEHSADEQLRALWARVLASGVAVPSHAESTARDMIEHTPGVRVEDSEAERGSAEVESRSNEGGTE